MAEGRGANYNPKHQELADRTQTLEWGVNLLARMNFFVLNKHHESLVPMECVTVESSGAGT